MSKIYDLAVVGAGIHGSSAAYFARKAGLNVLLLEQFALPHVRGSSVGHSRITRCAYPEAQYASMMTKSHELWQDLERSLGKQLFRKVGLMFTVLSGSKMAVDLERNLRTFGHAYRKYDASSIRSVYPQVALASEEHDRIFFIDPNGGILLANRCLAAIQQGFIHAGGVVRDNEKVLNVDQKANGEVHIRTYSGSHIVAKKAILVPGAWAPRMFADLGVKMPIEPNKIITTYWRIKDSAAGSFHPTKWPAMIWKLGVNADVEVSGMPEIEFPGYVKMFPHFGYPINPDERDRATAQGTAKEQEMIQFVSDFLSRHLPGVDSSAPKIVETCMYSMIPDNDFVIDVHPTMSNVVLASCCSGHGFKLSPVVGTLLVQLATNKQPLFDLSPFRISRFAKTG